MSINGKITKGLGGIYGVKLESGETVNASMRGVFRKAKITPTIGDNVVLSPSGDPDVEYVVDKILPRKSYLIRPAVANVDVLLLCFAAKDPEPDLKLLDKMLIICALINVKPIIVFTKSDLDTNEANRLKGIYEAAGYDCLLSDKDTPIEAQTIFNLSSDDVCFGFAGPSGVGKSTLCNHLLEGDVMKVGNISDRLKRGKHTTRHVELFDFYNGYIVDTPGFTSLSLFDLGVEYKQVILGYPEITKVAEECRFDDCRHISERDCAVRESVGTRIDKDRYDRYVELEEDLYNKRNDYSGRRKFVL